MTYKEKMQWNELERLLPMLKESLKKERIAQKLDVAISDLKETIEKLYEAIYKIEDLKEDLGDALPEIPSEEEESIQLEIGGIEIELENYCKKYDIIVSELEVEETYYRIVCRFFKGMKIRKRQVSVDEFEALLYFMWITRMNPNDLFDNFCQMYPWIREKWKEEIGIK